MKKQSEFAAKYQAIIKSINAGRRVTSGRHDLAVFHGCVYAEINTWIHRCTPQEIIDAIITNK
tara:strand:+ start:456 stop:644 length:189 start_codon:yes stop_codon:yes gene_type:complete